MIELRHITMVNWHLFDAEDIEVGGHIGVLGENRSGKSTVLDMMQVVLTGASGSYMRLNAIAGESGKATGGSKRSVLGYCLGALGDDQTRRQDSLTYIALGFESTDADRKPVTIGLAIEARKSDPKETILGRFVVVGRILRTQDFLDERDGERFPAQWDDVRARIVEAVGPENFQNHRDRPLDFVREYMRVLVPGMPAAPQNAGALQKAVVNALTLNQNLAATEFVRRFILEENDIRIGELRDSIQTYRGINETIAKMRRKLDALKTLREVLQQFETALETKSRETWISARAGWLAARAANRDILQKLSVAHEREKAELKEIEFLDEEIDGIEKEVKRLNEQIAEHDAKSGRGGLLRTLQAAKKDEEAAERDFRRRVDEVKRLNNAVSLLHNLRQDDVAAPVLQGLRDGRFASTVANADSALASATPGALPDAAQSAEASLIEVLPEVAAAIKRARTDASAKLVEAQKNEERLRSELDRSALTGGPPLSDPADHLCRSLRQKNMAPRVLCELIEIERPEWTAAEGLLARDREAVFVDRKDIFAATTLFKEGRREFRGASLVSLNKLEVLRAPPEAGTFPTIFRTTDPDAMAFLIRRYGNVRLANTLQEFERPGRAIMTDGLYDDGLVRSHRAANERDYRIGRAARAQAVHRLAEERAEWEEVARKLDSIVGYLERANNAIQWLSDLNGPGKLTDISARFIQARDEWIGVDRQIAALDQVGDGGLKQKRTAQVALKKTRDDERNSHREALGKARSDIEHQKRMLGLGETSPGSDFNLRLARRIYRHQRPMFSWLDGRASYRARLDIQRASSAPELHRAIKKRADEKAAEADEARQRAELSARTKLKDYFNEFGTVVDVGAESELMAIVKPWAITLIELIEGNELRQYERQAREAAEKAKTLIRGDFINALTQRINKMDRDLRTLNENLRDHPFHNERYSFHKTAVADFQPILRVLEIAGTSSDALDMLFRGDFPEDYPHRETILALEALLEDPNRDVTQFEDYRNFYTFEIHMEDINTGRRTKWETRRGTGSGAEQQVPIYVAIGASLATVYGGGRADRDRPKGISLAIFDEAFSKMDGKNQRQMMSFYKDLGLQIVIAAPFEKRVAVLEHMETIVEVDRIEEQSQATVIRLKEQTRSALRDINPDLLTDEQVLARTAAE
ncbi:hypothetical protein RHODGE_RHODGE_03521 [Rhodoplanes serenus]|uniref:Chromosome partition protein Smc n=1 Tax=Rhodoplanes serenus TaxID=200615 RepID=A0A3S4B2S5_9BRAD|nr:SbcC/MukB-like Walker B domain-containing protein [Rhodoplanes serenus]VCU10332.1 hypothetical protein RHODGE_RHODGE_03521 [Rhodoplanes serenus]